MKQLRISKVGSSCFCFAFFVYFVVPSAFAGTPRLVRVVPPGGQRGTTVEVDLNGRDLEQPRAVLCYEPGITVESVQAIESVIGPTGKPTPVQPGTHVRARLKL